MAHPESWRCDFERCQQCPECLPTMEPTKSPSIHPTFGPTTDPTKSPSSPTHTPSNAPTSCPSVIPTLRPTLEPNWICLGDEKSTIDLDFTDATIVYSNLGGNYNGVDPEETYYRGVATLHGNRVNLRITTDDDTYNCRGNPCSWVRNGMLGQVPMRGTSTDD
eukprot:UN27324